MVFKLLDWMFRGLGMNPKNNRWDKYFTVLSVGLSCVLVLPLLCNLPNMFNSVFGFLIFIYISCSITSFFGFVVMSYLYRHQYRSIRKGLMRVGNELLKMGAGPSPRSKADLVAFLSLTSWYCAICIMNLLKMASIKKWTRSLFSILSNLPMMHYLMIVNDIGVKFTSLNDYLTQVSTTSHYKLSSTISTQLEDIFHVHTALHERVSEINTYYFFLNLLSFISNMSAIVFSLYGYLQYIDGKDIFELDMIITLIIHATLFITQAMVCHACSKQANSTVFLAHRVLHADSPLHLWEYIGDFSRLSLDNKVAFSVGGLFNLDRPLITKAVAASLSYLIVAVQLQNVQLFDNSDKNNNTTPAIVSNSSI